MNSKTETLFGGRLVTVQLLDGSKADFRVRQLPLSEYETAFKLVDDEIALTALICGHEKAWANNLQPESYERLQLTAQEVNANGFFAWSQRQQARAQAALRDNVAMMAALPPEVLKLMTPPTSPTSSPIPRPR